MTGPGAEEEMMEYWEMCPTRGCSEYSEYGVGLCRKCREKNEQENTD